MTYLSICNTIHSFLQNTKNTNFNIMNQSFQVEKQNIYKVSKGTEAFKELNAGEVRFKIQKYAFTTNNITYAVSGFKLKYWNFFPVDEQNGIIPVWGYGIVVASKNENIKVGERCYGYFPMSEYLTVSPANINPFGFSDGAEHRRKLSPIYNFYSQTAADPTYNSSTEDYIPIIKPLFATSFLIYHYLKNENFLNAEQIVLTSASSKTGTALAFMLKQHQATDGKRIIGLTSSRNINFVNQTNYYDQVIAYDNVQNELENTSTVVVDFAGNFKLLANLSDTLGDALHKISLVGLTDWKGFGSYSKIPNTEFFFAPTHIQNMYKTKGVEATNMALNKALVAFITDIQSNIELETINNFEQLKTLYLEMVDGKVNPKKGYLVSL